jgi:hypothetical protein
VREFGYEVTKLHELRGHRDVTTTMLYPRVPNRGADGLRKPLGR